MVYTFELFLRRNKQVDHHRAMAYGIFPLCNSKFEIAEGKFKVPMLRGEIDLGLDKFSDTDKLYRRNIDEWLCNLYFSVEKVNQLSSIEKDYLIKMMPPNPEADKAIDRTSKYTLLETSPEVDVSEVPQRKMRRPIELIAPEQFEEYKHSVLTDDFVFLEQAYIRKTKYIISELFSELGFQSYRHFTMWFTLLILLLMIWVSRFSHYMG
jgi:hypothetical protein